MIDRNINTVGVVSQSSLYLFHNPLQEMIVILAVSSPKWSLANSKRHLASEMT